MKKYLWRVGFILLLFFSCDAVAQSPDSRLVAPAGNSYSSPGYQLDWSLGEIAIQSLQSGNSFITLGMHQPTYDFISATDFPEEIGQLQVFPNPASDYLIVRIHLHKSLPGSATLYDVNGISLLTEVFKGAENEINFNLLNLPAGQYTCLINMDHYRVLQPIQIIKVK